MTKKLFLVLLAAVLLFAGVAQAQTQTNDLPEPGMLPDSPFYFLKSWSEGIGTFFTFGDVAKTERFSHLAEVRLSEAKALVEKGKQDIAEKAVLRYQDQLEAALTKAAEAKAKGLDTDEVLAKVAEATLKHQEVLAEVYEKVPEQAKETIQRAMEVGMRGHEEALQAISGKKREEVMEKVEEKRQEVEQKFEGLRKKGIPVPRIRVQPEIEQPKEQKNIEPVSKDESEMAKTALVTFFDYLSKNEFEKALSLFSLDDPTNSWEGLESFSLPEERNNKAKVLENYCKATGTCLKAKVLEVKKATDDEYNLVVQFLNKDSSIYVFGPCCGATEETMPSKDKFDYKVKKINNTFKVLTAPLYRP